jgi:diguanylate cyclase (GGDEF)-like protein
MSASEAIADGNFSVQIAKADELRLSDPKQSKMILENIDEAQLRAGDLELYQFLTGYNLFINGNVQKAKSTLKILSENSKTIDIKVRALGTLLSVNATSNDWLNALQTVNILFAYLEPELNPKNTKVGLIKYNILNFYNNIGEYELAKNIAKDLLNIDISPRLQCLTSIELLNSKIKASIDSINVIDFEKASKLCTKLNEPVLFQSVNGYFAEYHLALNSPRKAVELLESNIANVKATQYQALIAGFYSLLAQSHLALENYSEAERCALILIDTEEQHHYQPSITTAYKVLAEVNEQRKYYDQAYYYYKQYSEANQIELDQNNAKLLAIQKAKLDVIEKNTQIALLDKENTLLKTQALLDNESAQNRRLALALLIMALVVFILWAYKNRKTYLEMRYFAQTDELTGIANRHHFAQLAHSAIKLCRKTDQPVSFMIFDLDFFKKINDSYGHLVGDEALKMAVNAAKSACRLNDTVGRLGGEEFGIILPGCGNHLATHIAEKCRRAIEKVDTSASGHKFALTASFGVADSSVCSYDFTTLFAGADRALYQAKDLGRNQVYNYQANSFAYDI